jgi:hypothetical protein
MLFMPFYANYTVSLLLRLSLTLFAVRWNQKFNLTDESVREKFSGFKFKSQYKI